MNYIIFTGISLSMNQWNKFKELVNDIQETIEKQ